MSKEYLSERDLLDSLFEFEKAEAATIEKLGPGKWDLAPIWFAPKDGKPQRPLYWKPSLEAWEKQCIKMHEKQAKDAKEFAEANDERIRRAKLAGRSQLEISNGADFENLADNESRSDRIDSVQLIVV